MPDRTRQPNTAAPERQTTEAGRRAPEGQARRRRKKRPPLSTVLFPKRAQRLQRKRRQRAAPDSRAERRRQRLKRQQRYRFLYKAFTLALIVCAGVLALTLFFKVDTVRIQGRSRYADAELLETAGIEKGDNLFLFSRSAVRKRLFDAYPYLDTAIVERKLPNKIVIRVADAKPAVAIGSETTYYYMDAGGKLLEQVAVDQLGEVPVVTGVTIEDAEVGKRLNMRRNENLRQLSQLLTSLDANDLMDRVDFINLSEMNNVRVGCDGHMYIRFGTLEDLDKKMRFAQKFVAETSASLYCEIEVSGEILWESRPSYRVIPVSKEDVAAQSRDLDAAILVEPEPPDGEAGADPNAPAEPGQEGETGQTGADGPDGEAGTDTPPAPLPQTTAPTLSGPAAPAGDGEDGDGKDDGSKDSDESGGDSETEPETGSAAKPRRYVPGAGGTNWRAGGA